MQDQQLTFISYAAPDAEAAQRICSALEEAGIWCFIAPRDIRPGVGWASAIISAIDTCGVMVLVFSAAANESPHVLREIERAVSKRTRLIPFLIEEVKPSKDIEYFISSAQWIDATALPLERHLEALASSLRDHQRDAFWEHRSEEQAPPPSTTPLQESLGAPTTYSPALLSEWSAALDSGLWQATVDCRDETMLQDLRMLIDDAFERHAVPDPCGRDVQVALTELARNVARHAESPLGRLEMGVSYQFSRFSLSVASLGPPFTKDDALAKYEEVPAEERRVHGLQNLLGRGQLRITSESGTNVVVFSSELTASELTPDGALRVRLEPNRITLGSRRYGFEEFVQLLGSWVRKADLLDTRPFDRPDERFDPAKLNLLSDWPGQPPVRIELFSMSPDWSLVDLEIRTIAAFQALVKQLEMDARFDVVDVAD